MDPRFTIPLTDPRLGRELLNDDPYGSLAINVWVRYCAEELYKKRPAGTNGPMDYESLPAFQWFVDRSWPEPIAPQEAVDLAQPLVSETIQHLESGSADKALKSARSAGVILFGGSSEIQRGRGQPASMRPTAVRAYIIRKFNPHPKKPGQSIVRWDDLADMLFLKDGKCSRVCRLTQHQYDSPCTRALQTAVTHLKAAMKHDGIPT